jgi:hypothetical protein
MSQAEAGKGSAPRKQQDREAYSSGWDRIFGRKDNNGQDKETKTIPPESAQSESKGGTE